MRVRGCTVLLFAGLALQACASTPEVTGEKATRVGEGAALARESARLEAAGDVEGADRAAEAAYLVAPSDASEARVSEMKGRLGARLLATGRAALIAGESEQAVRLLTEALTHAPDAEGRALLEQAHEAADSARRSTYWQYVEAGSKSMAAHDWEAAVLHFTTAHASGASDESLRKEAFCRAMQQAEAAVRAGDERTARSRFEEALLWGLDTEFVRARRDSTELARKRAHAAAVDAGTKAMEAHDWATAVSQFGAAHRMGTSEDSLKKEAFCKAMQEAETAAASGDERVARSRFEEALLWGIDAEYVRTRRDGAEESRKKAFAAAVEAGTKAMEARDWTAAASRFAAAHRAGTSPESLRREGFCKAMLEAEAAAAAGDERTARSRYDEALMADIDAEFVRSRRDSAENQRKGAYELAVEEGARAMAARDWAGAVAKFGAAHKAGTSADSLRKESFSKAMLEAEAAAASGDERTARSRFEEALLTGVENDHVRARMVHLLPNDYVITIHEGVVLPVRPGSQFGWDGDEAWRLGRAGELYDKLAKVNEGGGSPVAKSGDLIAAAIPLEMEQPDTYLIVTTGSQTFSSRDWVRHDACRPSWEFRIPIRAKLSSAEPVNIAVFDRDAEADDRIGSFQLTGADLFSKPGEREFYFVDEKGSLKAGGILAVRISVQRQ